MKVSLNWLTDYVDVSMPAQGLADLLVRIGFGVEGVVETDTDIVLDLEVTSNRPDMLGHIGVAREIAAATGAKFRPPKIGRLPSAGRAADLTSVEVQVPDLCPRYTARVLRGVKVGPSPRWMVERLQAVGLRSINNVVDVTNYVLMEYSQPLHAFDYDRLAEHRIVVRRARAGEHLVSIDGTKCALDESMLVIADAARPVAVAGVMGGLDTEVADKTVHLLIESAQFDPLAVRRTSRKLGLTSESNYRFERGVDPVGVETASRRACQLILQLGGGRLAGGLVDAWAAPPPARKVAMRPRRCDALLGTRIPVARQTGILRRLGLAPRRDGGRILCTIPSHRADLTREVDLIEEVIRLEGYDRIPVAQRVTHAVTPEDPAPRLRRLLGEVLTAAGFDEAITFSFVDEPEAALFGFEKTVRVDPLVRKINNTLRPTLLPSLLRACKTNQDAGNAEVCLFEIAAVFRASAGGGLPDEHVQVGLVTTGDLADLRGAIEAAVARLAPGAELSVRPGSAGGLADGAAAEVLLDGKAAGHLGLIADKVRDYYGLERSLAAGTLRFDALLEYAGQTRTYQPVPKFPPVRRDLSLIVDEAVMWADLSAAILGVDQPTRQGMDYVTTYRGQPIPPGRKSVTVTLTYRSPTGTLRSQDVDEQVRQVVQAMKDRFAAELRQ